MVLPKVEQNIEDAEQVERVMQLTYQEESPDPSQWAGPSQAEVRGAVVVKEEDGVSMEIGGGIPVKVGIK